MEQQFHIVGRGGSQAVERAAQLLTMVLEGPEEIAVGELGRAAGLPKSTTSRLLGALERHGLVERGGARGKVRPGPAVVRFAHNDAPRRGLPQLPQDAPQTPAHARQATVTDRRELAAELERVRRAGWATACDELEPGLASIAAPVRARSGETVAALSVSGPMFRLTDERLEALRPILIDQSGRLAERLGYRAEGAA